MIRLLFALAFLPPVFARAENPLRVEASGGAYEGREVHGARLFPAIAYAKPPVGPLRWRRPVPETRALQAKAPVACPTTNWDYLGVNAMPYSEDCLYLNVWAPKDGEKHPVLFLIHGGGGLAGSGLTDFYDGSVFAREGVVVVAMNYRLGELGWGPKLEKEPGSLGLLDQALALRWTIENIARFGGDPRRIFLMGHSKGAESVMTLLESGLAGEEVVGGISMSGARTFNAGANKWIPANQGVFTPGELTEDWRTMLKRKGFFVYVPELPQILEKRADDHRFRLLVTVLYAEAFGGQESHLYCSHALAIEQMPSFIEPYYLVLHAGSYEHGDEMRALFRETSYGRILRGYLLDFFREGKPPSRFLGGEPKPFNPSRQVTHLFPSFTLADTFADDWHETFCGDQKNYPGSLINGRFYGLEKLGKWLGGADFRASPFPPRPIGPPPPPPGPFRKPFPKAQR